MTMAIKPRSGRSANRPLNSTVRRNIEDLAHFLPSHAPSLRSLSIPRFALRRSEAAASFGISEGTFDKWVKEGKMPRGRPIEGVVLWDTRELAAAWDNLANPSDGSNPFDRIVA